MAIGYIISAQDYAVHPSDKVNWVLGKMSDLKMTHLPVVKDGVLLGLISDDHLLEHTGEDKTLQRSNLSYLPIYMLDSQHIFDALLFFQIQSIALIPVVDAQHNYIGALSPKEVLGNIGQMMSVQEPGGIIVLEMSKRDNALSHIAHIVESDNAQILNSYVRTFEDSARIEVTIKVNRMDISNIVASLLRYDYTVIATYNDENRNGASQDHYAHLMNYINI